VQRCQAQPSTFAIAALCPAWASLIASCTPIRPRATRPLRKSVQNASVSASPTSIERIRTPHRRRVDVLLALATLATAWAGHQSSRWHSEQVEAQAKATASRIEAIRSADEANRQAQVDVSLCIQWVDARAQGQTELADFYRVRFTDRFQPAFKAWIAERPLTNPDAPSSPFVMKRYKLEASQEADSQEATADSAAADAAADIQRADKYVLAVVLFAACLFLAGLSTRLRTTSAQAVVLTLGGVLFIGTVIWVATFPVTVTI
jgi:hypothetical protein